MVSRRKRITAGIVAGVPLVAGALAWWWWLPSMAKSRTEEVLERRLGLTAEVGSASLRLSGVVLSDIHIADDSAGIVADVARVEVSLHVWDTITSGSANVEGVDVAGLEATLDLAQPAVEASLTRLREGPSEGANIAGTDGRAGAAGAQARLHFVDSHFAVRDTHGPLTSGAITDATLSAHRAEARLAELAIGGDGFDTLHLSNVEIAVDRDVEEGMVLDRFRAAHGEAIWAHSVADSGAPSTFARVRALIEAVRGVPAEVPADAAASDDRGFLARLSPAALIEIAQVSIRTGTDRGGETILESFSTSIERTSDDSLHARGRGAVGDDGALAWDFTVEPLALRAEGALTFTNLPLALVTPVLSDVPWYEPERGRLFGELHIEGSGPDAVTVEGRVAVRDAAFESARIAPEPIRHIDVEVEGRGTFHPPTRRLEIESARLAIGEAEATMSGQVIWTQDHYLVDVTSVLPATSCDAAVHAIPSDLLGPLAGFSFQGMLSGQLAVRVDSDALDETTLDIDVHDGCAFETVPPLADLTHFSAPFTHRVLEPDGTWFEMMTGPGTANWASLYETSPFLVHAVLAHEDSSFFGHSGFAPWAIRDALVRNLAARRFVVGASTITMQLAKNLFLHREKYLARKVQEVLLTWWLESALDKARLLELYLNVIEYGPSIYGVRQAAEHYFGRDPEELSLAESAFLACILPNPKLYHQQYERGELSSSMKGRMRRLINHMSARGRVDATAASEALAEVDTLAFHREGMPLPAPRTFAGRSTPLPFGLPEMWETDWNDEDAYEEDGGDAGDGDWVDQPL